MKRRTRKPRILARVLSTVALKGATGSMMARGRSCEITGGGKDITNVGGDGDDPPAV